MATWLLGATSLAGLANPAAAAVACSSTFTGTGAGTLASATQIPGSCLESITGNQGFNAYWEFSFDSPTTRNVHGWVQAGAFPGSFNGPGDPGAIPFGSFYGSLDLYTDNNGVFTNIGFDTFTTATDDDRYSGTTEASLGTLTFQAATRYIIGIEGSPTDPPFAILLDPVASGIPEPGTLSLMGAMAATLSFVRRRRRDA